MKTLHYREASTISAMFSITTSYAMSNTASCKIILEESAPPPGRSIINHAHPYLKLRNLAVHKYQFYYTHLHFFFFPFSSFFVLSDPFWSFFTFFYSRNLLLTVFYKGCSFSTKIMCNKYILFLSLFLSKLLQENAQKTNELRYDSLELRHLLLLIS